MLVLGAHFEYRFAEYDLKRFVGSRVGTRTAQIAELVLVLVLGAHFEHEYRFAEHRFAEYGYRFAEFQNSSSTTRNIKTDALLAIKVIRNDLAARFGSREDSAVTCQVANEFWFVELFRVAKDRNALVSNHRAKFKDQLATSD